MRINRKGLVLAMAVIWALTLGAQMAPFSIAVVDTANRVNSLNSNPVKGNMMIRSLTKMNMNPVPGAGRAIGDITPASYGNSAWEVLTEDGRHPAAFSGIVTLISNGTPSGVYKHEFSTAKYTILMRASFPSPYQGKRLAIYRSTRPGQADCLSAQIGVSGCMENFVGALAIVTFEVRRVADGRPAAALIREVVTVEEQSSELPDQPPFAMKINLIKGIGSDVQLFGYDESPITPAERAVERERARALWRKCRQELYIDGDGQPFAVVEWLHTTTRIRILQVHPPPRSRWTAGARGDKTI